MRGRPPKPKKERLVLLQVMVPPIIKKQMEEAAKIEGIPTSQYVRQILERW